MRIIRTAKELNPARRKVCLAIGFFDGVHLGHQQVIRQTLTDARKHDAIALVITFDQHPNTVVAPSRVPPLIYSLPQKLRAIESLGADTLLLIRFDKAFSEQSGEAFVRGLARDLGNIQSLCVGANFVFGHKRGGNVDLLRKLGVELRFAVHGMAAVSLDGQAVSSTRIRQVIRAGDLDRVSQMLGRAYSLAGTVIRGDGLGHRLGFPTANLDAATLALPPNGVYAVLAETGGKTCRAVLNIGHRPTLRDPNPQLRVEAHLIDFTGDLYGQELEVAFVENLRTEKEFASLTELRQQIARDILDAQMRF
ncbi:MAG TPA: bifunctional riboflavin kinase/FAD synthetase [Candidatus Paceibacterota bacterium]|nr:bifunctional riboflavin kinase/FAD synthetase [Verrucomicrobiota bacterium]HSA10389.1 bifunctional riboflavin kinase/FAD synthetase [Candidatus Paceibacterota bacterium]